MPEITSRLSTALADRGNPTTGARFENKRRYGLGLAWVGLTVSLLVGCGNALTPEEVAGTYLLVTVNGESLPYTAIESAGIILTPDGQFRLVFFIQGFGLEAIGTYTLGHDTVRLAFQGTNVLTGTIVGDRNTISQGVTLLEVTVTSDGDVLVFEQSLP